ncbi:MAG: LacI family DNA-binding transcriptional regulator [Lentisphaeria bacterium]|nr:LacI family DNA-binding transcriptional regulator [Lentisphaeria bacterium]
MAQRVTMQHIADAVHMSRASVSAVLGNKPHCFVSEKNRAHILQTAVRLGYTPNLLARGLRNGRTRMIGLLCTSLQSEIHQQEMVLLTNLLLEHGYSSNIVYYKGEMEKLRTSGSELVARGCDALVISRAQHGKGNEEHEIVHSFTDKAVFLYAGDPDKSSESDIVYDFRAGFLEALTHLKALGHRQVKMLRSRINPKDPGSTGFLEALQQLRMDADAPFNGMPELTQITPDFMKRFFRENPSCTAVICRNDLIAMRVIQSCAKLGVRIPEDFSVIGFDNIAPSEFATPALTTIRQPIETAAEETVKLLLNMLEDKEYPVCRSLPAKLVIRESTAKKTAGRTGLRNGKRGEPEVCPN